MIDVSETFIKKIALPSKIVHRKQSFSVFTNYKIFFLIEFITFEVLIDVLHRIFPF